MVHEVAAPTAISPQPPAVRWGRMWLMALAICAGTLGSAEAYWRSRGFQASVRDSLDLWQYWRRQVYQDDGKVVVLLGASRMHAAASLDTLRRELPGYRVIQLARYASGSPIGTLAELASDPKFRGIVVCDVVEPFLEPRAWYGQQAYYGHRPTLGSYYESIVDAWSSANLVALHRGLALPALGRAWLDPRKFGASFRKTWHFDRQLDLDFRGLAFEDGKPVGLDDPALAGLRNPHALSFGDLAAGFAQLREMTALIRSRGGEVVFIRMPSSGAYFAGERSTYPRAEFWDRFAREIGSPSIHFLDVPGMSDIECPDGSHTDLRDQAQFSRALVNELRRLEIIGGEERS